MADSMKEYLLFFKDSLEDSNTFTQETNHNKSSWTQSLQCVEAYENGMNTADDFSSNEYLLTFKNNWECESQHLDAWVEKLSNGVGFGEKKCSGSDTHCICGFCTKCFTSKSKLKTHIKYHNMKKSNKCEICSKCFTTVGNLKQHRVQWRKAIYL